MQKVDVTTKLSQAAQVVKAGKAAVRTVHTSKRELLFISCPFSPECTYRWESPEVSSAKTYQYRLLPVIVNSIYRLWHSSHTNPSVYTSSYDRENQGSLEKHCLCQPSVPKDHTQYANGLRRSELVSVRAHFCFTFFVRPHLVVRKGGKVQQLSSQKFTGAKRCPAPSPIFRGCDRQVSQVSTCIIGSLNERRACVVHGLGGAGKTQLSLRMIENTKDHWMEVVYVDATSQETTASTLKGFAMFKKIGNSHEDAI
jgi:hypothetical protein